MAKITVCDWCRTEVQGQSETSMTRNGEKLTLDLCDTDWKRLQKGGPGKAHPAAPAPQAKGGVKRPGLKAWGAENGFPYKPGAPTKALVAAWDDAHPD